VRPRRQVAGDNAADASAEAGQEDEDAVEQAENENSIIFDGEEGTMKFSGGQGSPFAVEMKELVRFWVQERRSVPCFLAAVTLELFERCARVEGKVDGGGDGDGGGDATGEGGAAA